jgi:hypothetical protein
MNLILAPGKQVQKRALHRGIIQGSLDFDCGKGRKIQIQSRARMSEEVRKRCERAPSVKGAPVRLVDGDVWSSETVGR